MQDYQNILPAIHAVYTGQTVFGNEIVSKIPQVLKKEKIDCDEYDITEKEFQVMTLAEEGLSNKEIANELFLSEGTVRNYINSILDEFKLRDRAQLAGYYLTEVGV